MRIFVTDCEGPISKNDNAMELTAHFIPEGERFFAQVSTYDDYLAYVEKKEHYKAGDTLRLILPFLKAFGATDGEIEKFSRENILLLPGAGETLTFIGGKMPVFIISTSYEPYIKALCEVIGFPFYATYCTELKLDRYPLPPEEERYLREVAGEIARMPVIEWEEGARGFADLPDAGREVVRRLNQVFWEELPRMKVGKVLEEVNPIGGEAKASAVRDILQKAGAEASEVMYVGDSITDLQALEFVRTGGGLAVSFNGNAYSIGGAQVACLGRDTGIISILARLFAAGGAARVMTILPRWGEEALRSDGVEEDLLAYLSGYEIGEVTPDNQALWAQRSQQFRKMVRGVRIGSLG